MISCDVVQHSVVAIVGAEDLEKGDACSSDRASARFCLGATERVNVLVLKRKEDWFHGQKAYKIEIG